jgi:hypothetical protein
VTFGDDSRVALLRVPLVATAVLLVALALYWLVAIIAGERKLANIEHAPPRGNYRIVLDFAPERFHQLLLQDRGRLVEVQGNAVFMMDVTPPALRDIAQCYWVRSVEAWAGR